MHLPRGRRNEHVCRRRTRHAFPATYLSLICICSSIAPNACLCSSGMSAALSSGKFMAALFAIKWQCQGDRAAAGLVGGSIEQKS